MEPTIRDGRLVEWFTKWRKPIRSWLRNRASVPPSDIDDLAQEVYVRLLKYSDDTAVENPQGYLFRIASNVANEWREKSRIKQPHDSHWLEALTDAECHQPECEYDDNQQRTDVIEAINRLPKRQRHVLLLHINEGLTYKQIEEREGLTYRIVLRDLTRAYAALRMELMTRRSA